MIKVNKDLIYVRKHDGSEALIWTKKENGKEVYRYQPVRGFSQDYLGTLNYEEASDKDPFKYLTIRRFILKETETFI